MTFSKIPGDRGEESLHVNLRSNQNKFDAFVYQAFECPDYFPISSPSDTWDCGQCPRHFIFENWHVPTVVEDVNRNGVMAPHVTKGLNYQLMPFDIDMECC